METEGVMRRGQINRVLTHATWWAFLFSLFFHASIVGTMAVLPESWLKSMGVSSSMMEVMKHRQKPKTLTIQHVQDNKNAEKQFVKSPTDKEEDEKQDDARFVSDKNMKKEGNPTPPEDKKDMPTVESDETREEIVLFDQDRQDGSPLHTKKGAPGVDSSPVLQRLIPVQTPTLTSQTNPMPPSEQDLTTPESETPKAVENNISDNLSKDSPNMAESSPDYEQNHNTLYSSVVYSDLNPYNNKISMPKTGFTPPPTPVVPTATYDPVFASDSQPGMRTYERKQRMTGRMSFGRGASLDADSTPTGQYMMAIYRAITASWYFQCDRNRDVIVAGIIRFRVWIDKNGKVVDSRQVSIAGAGQSQSAFTILAIRTAQIPPMPVEVQEKIVGDKLEILFDFLF